MCKIRLLVRKNPLVASAADALGRTTAPRATKPARCRRVVEQGEANGAQDQTQTPGTFFRQAGHTPRLSLLSSTLKPRRWMTGRSQWAQ